MAGSDDIHQLQAILDGLKETYRWDQAQIHARLNAVWSEALGPFLADRARLLSLQQGVLVVGIPSSSWAQELTYMKPMMIEQLQKRVPGLKLREIKSRVLSAREIRATPINEEPHVATNRRRSPIVSETNLTVLFSRVKEQYAKARAGWLQQDFVLCAQCQSPTPKPYRLCVICELRTKDSTS